MGNTDRSRSLVDDAYYPEIGDIIDVASGIAESPVGHEQNWPRPALVVSRTRFNKEMKMAWVCPITNTGRDSIFHIPMPDKQKVTGFILVDQLKSVDWVARKAVFVQKCPREEFLQAMKMVNYIAPIPKNDAS